MTVGSLAIRATRRPSIVARPVTTPSAPSPSFVPVGQQPPPRRRSRRRRAARPARAPAACPARRSSRGGAAARRRGRPRGPAGNRTIGARSLFGRWRRCQSTGPARSTWEPSGRPSTSCAAREASISAGRSIPVSTPISCSIETTSSVATLPVAPGGTGQPPSSPKLDSKESTPCSSAASTLARPWPRVLWKWAVSSTSPRRSRAAAKNSPTWRGLAIPVVSPKPTSAQPAAASRSAISKTRSGGTSPS